MSKRVLRQIGNAIRLGNYDMTRHAKLLHQVDRIAMQKNQPERTILVPFVMT